MAPLRRVWFSYGSLPAGLTSVLRQVGVTWRFDAPDRTAMLTPRRSLSSLASLQLRDLHGDFDAALRAVLATYWRFGPVRAPDEDPRCTLLRFSQRISG